jgi:pyrroline-5-carboxylate reductase
MHNESSSRKRESAAQEIIRVLGKDMTIKSRLIFLLVGLTGLFAPGFAFVLVAKSFAIALKDTIKDRDQLNWFVSFLAGDNND